MAHGPGQALRGGKGEERSNMSHFILLRSVVQKSGLQPSKQSPHALLIYLTHEWAEGRAEDGQGPEQ